MTKTNQFFKLAIQKSGRLHEETMDLIQRCGIHITKGQDQLKLVASDFPLEILLLRHQDIPRYLSTGVADAAILGENEILENQVKLTFQMPLGFSACRLSLAIPEHLPYPGLSYFQETSIATSYPNSLNAFLHKNDIRATIHEISGSVEITPQIGLAQGICDLVSTGKTLKSNGLKEVELVYRSQAILAACTSSPILSELAFRIQTVQHAERNKYVMLNIPSERIQEVKALLPGMKSPSILPLMEPGWVSVHSVISETDFWSKIQTLKAYGAEGILVLPIEKMID
jgi:ATP phosphoribosyltransferase